MAISIFGGPEQKSVLTDEQVWMLGNLSNTINRQIGQSAPVYEGQIAPDATQSQIQAFAAAPGLLQTAQMPTSAIESMLTGESAIGSDPQAYYYDAVYRPAKLAYDDATKELEARYGGSFGSSGGFQDILAENASRFGVGLGSQLADLAYRERDVANANRAMGVNAAMGQTRNLGSALGTMLGVGSTERGIQAEQNAEAYNKWQAAQPYNNPWLGMVSPVLGTQAFGLGQAQGALPATAGAIGGILSGIGSIVGGGQR